MKLIFSKRQRLPRTGLILLAAVAVAIAGAIVLPGKQVGQRTVVAARTKATPNTTESAMIRENLNKMPLYFIENKGQTDPRVAFFVQGRDKTVSFTPQGITFALTNSQPGNNPGRWTLKLDFLGANPQVKIVGQEQAEAVFSYFKGSPNEWKNGKTYKSIVYENLWPGIDLVYSGNINQMKYEFIVRPGADPTQIKLAYRGASSVQVNNAGNLEVKTPIASFSDDKPVSYQDVDGVRVEVPTAYALKSKTNEYRFRLGQYDRTKTLVIDPVMIVYCGYIGGSGSDLGTDIVVDNNGFAYVTGFTNSLERSTTPGYNLFPAKVGPDLSYNTVGCPNCYDAFVAKVRTDGTGLIYCGYIGGENNDRGFGITLDSQGRAYVVGTTTSFTKFPVKIGPKLVSGGGQEGFIARVNANGTALDYCGYIGGSTDDGARDVAVDKDFSAYVVGSTDSKDLLGLMNVVTSWNWNFSGGLADAYAIKINANGTTAPFGGYVGGSDWDSGTSIDIDGEENAYITGFTLSKESSFPVKVGPDLTFNGSQDGFIARINHSGMKLDYCGYIGGKGDDTAASVAVTNDGYAYIGGDTSSDEKSFPVVAGPDLTFNGVVDAFVAKVKQDGTGLVFCGYIGGAQADNATGVGIDSVGNAYLCGATNSDEKSFPIKQGPDLSYNGNGDAFVAKVGWNSSLIYCGYIGGTGDDYAWAIATNKTVPSSDVYVIGRTDSTEAMGFPVKAGPDLTFNGNGPPLGNDAFVAKVSRP